MNSKKNMQNEQAEFQFDSDLEKLVEDRDYIAPKYSSTQRILQAAGEVAVASDTSRQVYPWMLIAASILGIFIFSILQSPDKSQQTVEQPIIQNNQSAEIDLSDELIESKIANLEYRTASIYRRKKITNYKPISKTSYFESIKQINGRLKQVKTKIPEIDQGTMLLPEKPVSPSSKIMDKNILKKEA